MMTLTTCRIPGLIALFLATLTHATAAVHIHADFEGGSIGKIEEVTPNHFRCGVKGDVDQDKRNRQASWYYFQIDGAAGRELTIEFIDLPGEYDYKPSLSIAPGTRPFVSADRHTWTPLPDSAVEFDESNKTLRIRFTPTRSPYWVAHVPPYTTVDLAKLMAAIKGRPHVRSENIGKTPGGRNMLMLTVTNEARPDLGKKVIWLMARQHAWESGTSWVMEGAIRFLAGDSVDAVRLRDNFIFKLFPMADPDGVARGGVRFNAAGYDVNRNWDAVDPKLMPEIAAMRTAVLSWVDGGGRLDLFVALHNTNNDYMQGPLTKAGPEYRQMIEHLADLLRAKTVYEPKAPRDQPRGEVARGRMTAVEGLFHDRGIRTLLIEQNTRTNSKLGKPLVGPDYIKFGEQLPALLAEAVTASKTVPPPGSTAQAPR